jgi:hypothetical protein
MEENPGAEVPERRFSARVGCWGLAQRGGVIAPPYWTVLRYRTEDGPIDDPTETVGDPIIVRFPTQKRLAWHMPAEMPPRVATQLVAALFRERRRSWRRA